jgi:hypothetical protein
MKIYYELLQLIMIMGDCTRSPINQIITSETPFISHDHKHVTIYKYLKSFEKGSDDGI